MSTYEALDHIIETIDEEIYTIKSVVESLEPDDPFAPLIVFYKDTSSRQAVVSVTPEGEFVDTVCRISEALHLYPCLSSHAAVIAISSKLSFEDDIYNAVNIFVISEENAWSIILPYTRNGSEVIWHSEHDQFNQIDEQDFDDQGKDMVSMFYMYVNTSSTHLTLSEVLSYLSTTSAAVNFMDQECPSYFDFSNNEMNIMI